MCMMYTLKPWICNQVASVQEGWDLLQGILKPPETGFSAFVPWWPQRLPATPGCLPARCPEHPAPPAALQSCTLQSSKHAMMHFASMQSCKHANMQSCTLQSCTHAIMDSCNHGKYVLCNHGIHGNHAIRQLCKEEQSRALKASKESGKKCETCVSQKVFVSK